MYVTIITAGRQSRTVTFTDTRYMWIDRCSSAGEVLLRKTGRCISMYLRIVSRFVSDKRRCVVAGKKEIAQ